VCVCVVWCVCGVVCVYLCVCVCMCVCGVYVCVLCGVGVCGVCMCMWCGVCMCVCGVYVCVRVWFLYVCVVCVCVEHIGEIKNARVILVGLTSDETFVRYRRNKCVIFKWTSVVRGLRGRICLPRLGYYPVMTIFELVIDVWFPRKDGIS